MANQITVTSGTGNIQITTSRSVIGTVANVASANYANFAGQVIDANQPNITTVGTLSNLTVSNLITTQDLTVTGNLSVGNLVANNANYANFAGVAYSVSGANVSGAVANATYAANAGNANIANTAYAVSGANVSGSVANANYANIAGTAYSVAVGNVSGIGNIATINLDGNSSNVLRGNGTFAPEGTSGNANYANFAGTAFSVSGSNVSGSVANANYANISGTAYSVNGANVSGAVANATYAANAGNANIANTAYAVSGANVSGSVANANYANVAGTAYSVSVGNVSGIGNIATINLDGNASNLLNGAGSFVAIPTNVANANYANYAGTVLTNSQPNITSVGTLTNLTVSGNIIGQSNAYVSNSLVLSNTIQIDSPGYYLPYGATLNNDPISNVIYTVLVSGDVTSGSNVMTNVSLSDYNTGSPLNLSTYASVLGNLTLLPNIVDQIGWYDAALPPVGTISNVDVANSTITYSNNFLSTSTVSLLTGGVIYDTPTQTYMMLQQIVAGTASSTSSATNEIVLDTTDPIDFYTNVGTPIMFIGTGFGNITPNTVYYVDTIVQANSAITISDTQFGPTKSLTNGSGTLRVLFADYGSNSPLYPYIFTIIPTTNTFYAGPWANVPSYTDFSTPINYNFTVTPNISVSFSKALNYNDNPPNQIVAGAVANLQYNQLVGPTVVGTKGTPTLTGRLGGQSGINGIVAINDGTDANLTGLRTSFAVLSYTDGGSDQASIINPVNPGGLQMTAYTGNATTPLANTYLRSGRSLGRIAWYASQQINGGFYTNPGSSPYAGIYVQALGDWNSSVNTSLPMVMAFQYSPLNAATAGGPTNYARINRTFLQAANNTTTIGGATNIEFRPLARSNSGQNNRSPSALGNVSINPQKFVDISGYTQGNAVSNGAGALLNVTTTASTWNGDVALRLSRTVGNTANMEFKLPTANANTMVLVDNASGNTIATFTNGDVKVANATINTGGFMKLASYTAAALNAITGQIGWMAAVSDSASGGNPNGMIAFWDTTNARWSYVHDNSAV